MTAITDLSDGLAQHAALIQVHVGAWHEYGYEVAPGPGDYKLIPPLGDRSPEAVKGAAYAVEEIDKLIMELHMLREQLCSELRQHQDMVDMMVARLDAKHGPVSPGNA